VVLFYKINFLLILVNILYEYIMFVVLQVYILQLFYIVDNAYILYSIFVTTYYGFAPIII